MMLWLIRNADPGTSHLPLPHDPLSEKAPMRLLRLGDSLNRAIKKASTTGAIAVVSSTHRRAIETVAPLARQLGCTIETAPGFRSIDLGAYYGKSMEEIRTVLGESGFNEMLTLPDPEREYFPHGETLAMQSARVLKALEAMEARFQGEHDHVVISTHATCIQIILCVICGMPLSRLWTWRIAAASFTIVEKKQGRFFIDRVSAVID